MTKSLGPKIALIVCAVGLTLAFQNCGGKGSSDQDQSTSSSQTLNVGGSGNGYDGKTYVLVHEGDVCSDGSVVENQIEFKNGQAYLTRENCVDLLNNQYIVAAQINPQDTSYILFKGEAYVDALSLFYSSTQDSEGNVYLLGDYQPVGQTAKFPFVAKFIPPDGLVWIRKVDSEAHTTFGSAALNKAGELVAFAANENGLTSFKISKVGAILGNQKYSFGGTTGSSFQVWDSASDSAGNLYVTVRRDLESYLLKLDESGNLLWQLSAMGGNDLTVGLDDSVYVQMGCGYESCMTKISSTGQVIWALKFSSLLYDVHSLGDGSIVVVGSTNFIGGAPVMAHIASDGTIIWAKSFGRTTSPSPSMWNFEAVTSRADGSLFAIGSLLQGASRVSGFMVQMTSNGDLKSAAEYPSWLENQVLEHEGHLTVIGRAATSSQAGTLQSFALGFEATGSQLTCESCVSSMNMTTQNYSSFSSRAWTVSPTSSSFSKSSPPSTSLTPILLHLDLRK